MTLCRSPIALCLAFAACGGGSTPAPTPVFGGTIAGASFAPADAAGFLMAPMACGQIGPGTHTMVLLHFSTAGGTCALAQDQAFCGERGATVSASVAIVRENVNSGTVPAIRPGTYTSSGSGVVDAHGIVQFFWASVDRNDGTCTALPGGPKEGGTGTLVLEEVGPSRLRGSASIVFDDGSALSGPFDVAVCAASSALQCASLKGGCSAVTCVP